MRVSALLLLSTLAAPAAPEPSFLGTAYPLEATPSFPAGLYHWMNCLAGSSGGKTEDAHRGAFVANHGRPSDEDREQLEAFLAARLEHMRTTSGRDGSLEVPRSSALLGIFCAAPTLDAALARAKRELSSEGYAGLEGALRHFAPKYEAIWRNGEIPRAFLERVRRDPRRDRLAGVLERMARFYGVDLASAPPPAIALVPVPDGFGTHAQAVGRHLLLEIRPRDDLANQASVIVHENAHYLWTILPDERRSRLERAAREAGPAGELAWEAFHEALPTALGQGVADREFRPDRWSSRTPWYHDAEIDAYAKALYTLVRSALAAGKSLDEAFVQRAVARFPAEDAPSGVTPR